MEERKSKKSEERTDLTLGLSKGTTFILKIEQDAAFNTVERVNQSSDIKGEMRLTTSHIENGRIGVSIDYLGLVSSGVLLENESTGHISIKGRGAGSISLRDGQWQFEANLDIRAVYRLVGQKIGYIQVGDDVFDSPKERFSGRLLCLLTSKQLKAGRELQIEEGTVNLVYQEGGLGIIRSILLQLRAIEIVKILGPKETGRANLNNPCHPDLVTNIRTLKIRPVGFRSSDTDANPTGASVNRQFNAVNAIWGKCCIQFDVQPIHIVTDATLKTTSSYTAIRDSYTDPDADTIEVFFAGNALTTIGGGVAFDSGEATSKVVITDQNVGNDNLLAHELGHTLDGMHPGVIWAGHWTGDQNSVLVPSGSPNVANPDENTHFNCISANNPAMSTSVDTCCLTHDITNHYIRDFPEDIGTEPNVAPAGRNFYSMSNLWNRHSNNPGGINADDTPEHQNPIRYDSSGNPFTNYLYAKIEAIVNLPPRNMEVKYYIKHPGSGGGATNIHYLGSVPVPDSLSLGVPETVSLPWEIPDGTPNHSCVFAVIRSPSEPDQDIASLGFREVEAVIREDNDWVQRNLEVGDYADGNANAGQSYNIWFSPIIIAYPEEMEQKPLPIILKVNTSGTLKFEKIGIEIPGLRSYKVKPGAAQKIDLDLEIEPGNGLALVVTGVVPETAEIGETYFVDIEPILGKIQLIGYRFETRIAKPHDFLAQTIDIGLAAFRDFAVISGFDAADSIVARKLESLGFRKRFYSIKNLMTWMKDVKPLIERFIEYLEKSKLDDQFDTPKAFRRFLDEFEEAKPAAFIANLRNAVARLQMLVYSNRKYRRRWV